MADRSNLPKLGKDIPQKLQDDLQKVKHYKPASNINPNINANHPQAAAVSAIASKHIRNNDPPTVQKVFDDSKERVMYDEIFGSMINGKGSSSYTAVGGGNVGGLLPAAPSSSHPNSSTDFTSSLLARLKIVEVEAKEARAKLSEQLTLNNALQQEVDHLKTIVSDPVDMLREIAALKEEKANMQDKIDEMENFLGDYGLVWIGSNSRQELMKAISPTKNKDSPEEHVIPYAEFATALNELNEIIFSEPAQIKKTGDAKQKARLVQASEMVERIRLAYYRNGLMIKNGPFRVCSSESYLSFVQDIMEGYFPSEFQTEYPDGVIFDLLDKSDSTYPESNPDSDNRMSRSQLLNRLPKTVIQKGEVIDLRADVASRLRGNAATDDTNKPALETTTTGSGGSGVGAGGGKVIIDTPAGRCAETETESHSLGNIVQIQIKWIDRAVFLAKMFEFNTVGELKACVLEHVKSSTGKIDGDFELRSAFPPRALQLNITLKEAGLSPNGTVHARKLP